MKIQKNIEVWLVKKRLPRPIDLVQYDTGIQLAFAVQDFTIPSGTTVTLYVQKPSGKFVYQETGITISDNTITVDLENQAITEHGNDVPYQVELKNGNDAITTFAGIFRVEKSLKDAGAVESKTVIAAFEAKTAEQIAQIEAAAQAQIEVIQNLYATYATKTEAANAIKGYLSGSVVFADDVSPVEHNPVVRVHGKNLFPTNELLVDKGTAYGGAPVPFYGVPGKNYTVSANFEQLGTVTKVGISLTSSDGRWLKEVYGDLTSGKLVVSFTYPAFYIEGGFVSIGFFSNILPQTAEGAKCQYTNIQVEEGSVATDYEPYIDPSTVTVKRCGKNLIPYPFYQSATEINGCKFTANSDGSISASGTATGVSYITIYSGDPLVKHGKFTLSIGGNYQNIIYHLIVLDSDGNELLVLQDYLTKTINADDYPTATKWMLNIKRHENKTVSGRVYPQIEAGEAATSYEGYVEPVEYIPAADGTVDGITSLSPNMTILTDNDGVVVECEYNRDTNKVIDKLINAITALGGTV